MRAFVLLGAAPDEMLVPSTASCGGHERAPYERSAKKTAWGGHGGQHGALGCAWPP
ncbi:hypothetical protein [Polyangium sp. y55x31]|uniref:hypothetical protein n=1 Tax=Polyangium sp. y55x31 TaxID=3042688 RepID=UPI002482BB54|nr:hypothetical protein [Polyangium sp. y55x31]